MLQKVGMKQMYLIEIEELFFYIKKKSVMQFVQLKQFLKFGLNVIHN